jgi:hypothetical protein
MPSTMIARTSASVCPYPGQGVNSFSTSSKLGSKKSQYITALIEENGPGESQASDPDVHFLQHFEVQSSDQETTDPSR